MELHELGWMESAQPLILVVEDEPLLRYFATEILEEGGFSVAEAINAENALEVLESRQDVSLLVTDIQMPGAFDGMELARRVHARWPHIRLMITSGRDRPRATDIPNDGRFIAKPYRPTELLDQVKKLLRLA